MLKTEDNIAIVQTSKLFSNFIRSHELYMSLLQEADNEFERSLDYARETDRLKTNCVFL